MRRSRAAKRESTRRSRSRTLTRPWTNARLEPTYKQHAAVDDLRGVILDIEVTSGEINERQRIVRQVDATMATTGGGAHDLSAERVAEALVATNS